MTNHFSVGLKGCCAILLLSAFVLIAVHADDVIKNIKNIYYASQQVIEEGGAQTINFNSEAGKDGYVIKKWHFYSDGDNSYKRGVYSASVFIVDDSLIKTRITMDSLSGDWVYMIEYFYYDGGRVAFIYEETTTYNGYEFVDNKPVSSGKLFVEERRSYYSMEGKRIRFLTKAFIKEEAIAVDPGQVQDVGPEKKYMTICELPFIDLLRKYDFAKCLKN